MLTEQARPSEGNSFTKIIAPAIQLHYAKCHGGEDRIEGDLNLLALRSDDLSKRVELVRRLNDLRDLKEMPPEGEPPLALDLRKNLVTELQAISRAKQSFSGQVQPPSGSWYNRPNDELSPFHDGLALAFSPEE